MRGPKFLDGDNLFDENISKKKNENENANTGTVQHNGNGTNSHGIKNTKKDNENLLDCVHYI